MSKGGVQPGWCIRRVRVGIFDSAQLIQGTLRVSRQHDGRDRLAGLAQRRVPTADMEIDFLSSHLLSLAYR